MDYFIENRFPYKDYIGKSLLVVGGGPSTLDVNWNNLDVDYIWSCNGFYLNDKVSSVDLDLVALGNLQDWNHPNLTTYLEEHSNTKILLETNYLYPDKLSKNKLFMDSNKGRVYQGQLAKDATGIVGPPARLMVLACCIGIKDLYFVGIDGFDPQLKNTHAFTKEEGLKPEAVHNTYEKYLKDHTFFAKSIYEKFGNRVNFHNLGEKSKAHNIISITSKQHFPLDEKVLEILGKSSR